MTHQRIQYSLDGETWQDCDRIEVRISPLTESEKYDEPDRYPTSHDPVSDAIFKTIDEWTQLSWAFVPEGVHTHLCCEVTSELNILGVYSEWQSYCDVYDAMIS